MGSPVVVHIIDRLPPDGAERLLVDILRYRSSEFDYRVLCLIEGGPLVAELEDMGVPVAVLGRRNSRDIGMLFRLRRWLRDNSVKVVHTHLFTADAWGRLAARLAGIAAVFSTVHSTNTWKGPLHRLVDFLFAYLSTRVIACSEEVARVLRERDHLPARRITTIFNGVDFRRLEAETALDLRAAFGIAADTPTLALVGRLHEAKGHLDLLPILRRLRDEGIDFHMLFVGEGEMEADIRREIEGLGLQGQVTLTGFRRDIGAILEQVDILAMPSRWEGLPMTLLEAMAKSRAIVATAVGGIPNVIADGQTGLLVESGNPDALRDALRRLLTDPTLRRELGAAARREAHANYSAEAVMRRYEDLYRDALGAPQGRVERA